MLHPRSFVSYLISLLSIIIFLFGCNPKNPDEITTFRMALSSEPPTLDWNLATDNVSFDVITNIMEGLTEFDEDLNPQPAIARSWDFSEDGKKIIFHLRDDVLWSDGRPLKAEDFEYSWKRLLNPATGAEYAYFLYDILNAYEYNTGRIKDPDKVGVRAIDDHTLEVRLKKPVVYFPSLTTFMVTFPMRRDIVERYGNRWTDPEHIVTLGPFRVKEWFHEYKLILERNERYYGKRPYLDMVVMYIVGERNTALSLYETGDIDFVELPTLAIPRYRSHPEYTNYPILRGYYYGFNVKKPPFDDVRVRRAFAMAIDREELRGVLQGSGIPTSSWIPQGMKGYNPGIGLPFDPERARRLLAEAGYPDAKGFPDIELVFNTDMLNKLVAENVQAQLEKNLGIRVSLDNQEWKVYLSKLSEDPPAFYRLGWGADFPDPDNFMNLFTSYSGNNHTNWANPIYDRLVSEASIERDEKKRMALYDRLQRILVEEDVPIIPLFSTRGNVLIKPYVKGLELNSMEILYLKKIRIEGRKG